MKCSKITSGSEAVATVPPSEAGNVNASDDVRDSMSGSGKTRRVRKSRTRIRKESDHASDASISPEEEAHESAGSIPSDGLRPTWDPASTQSLIDSSSKITMNDIMLRKSLIDMKQQSLEESQRRFDQREETFMRQYSEMLVEKEDLWDRHKKLVADRKQNEATRQELSDMKEKMRVQRERQDKLEALLDKRQQLIERRNEELREIKERLKKERRIFEQEKQAFMKEKQQYEEQKARDNEELLRREEEKRQRKQEKLEAQRRLYAELDPIKRERSLLESERQFHNQKEQALNQAKEDNERMKIILDRRMSEFMLEKEALIVKERELQEQQRQVEDTVMSFKAREAAINEKIENFESQKKYYEEQMEKAEKMQADAAKQLEQLNEDRKAFETEKHEWETKPDGPKPKNCEREYMDYELKYIEEQKQLLNEKNRELVEAQDHLAKRLIAFMQEKEQLILNEREAVANAKLVQDTAIEYKSRVHAIEQQEADMKTWELKQRAEQDRLDKGWAKLESQVQKLVQAKEKVANEEKVLDQKIAMNQELEKQIEALREPFNNVVTQIEEYSRKLALQDIREFWSPEEAKALTDIRQVHDYFKIKEVNFVKQTRLLTEENERMKDEVARTRMLTQREMSELKLKNAQLEGSIRQYKEETEKLTQENDSYQEGLKTELRYSQQLQEELDKERAFSKKLELIIQRKLIKQEFEFKEMKKAKKKELEAEKEEIMAKLTAEFEKRKEKESKRIHEKVKKRMIDRFARMKDELVQKEVAMQLDERIEKERETMKQEYEAQRAEWLRGITEQFEDQMYHQTEDIKKQIKEHYRLRIDKLEKELEKKNQSQNLVFHND